MIFSELFSHKAFRVAVVLVTNVFLTNGHATYSRTAISDEATNAAIRNDTTSTEFLVQNTVQASWWDKITGRGKGSAPTRGPSGDESVCALPSQEDHSRFMWNKTPRFVWFSNLTDLEVRIRSSDDPEFEWKEAVEDFKGDHIKTHITSYDGEELKSEELYYFEIYVNGESDNPLSKVPFKIIPEDDRLEIDKELSTLSTTEDMEIEERVAFFSNVKYNRSSGFLTEDDEVENKKDMFLFFDMVNEILNLNSSSAKDTYFDNLRQEYCEGEGN